MGFGLLGKQLRERVPEPERLGREVAASAVPLVEDEVDDDEHGGEPVREQVVGWDAEGDARRLDLALGAHQALGHGRLGDEERARDLRRREPAERSQSECDLRVDGERGVTAREDELEALVAEWRRVHRLLGGLLGFEQSRLRRQRLVASDAVDRAVPCRRDEPGPGMVGLAVAGPSLRGDRERVLRGFLGELEVAEEADQGREDLAPLLAEGLLEDRYHSMTGRTSMAPPSRAAGIRAASAIAASRSSASKIT